MQQANKQTTGNAEKLNNYFGDSDKTLAAYIASREYSLLVNDSNHGYLTKEEFIPIARAVAVEWERKILKRVHLKIAYPLAATNTSRDNQHNLGAIHDTKDIP